MCIIYNKLINNNLLFSSKMKDVIDVLAMQREKRNTLQKSITIDYTKNSDSFTISRFIFECGKHIDYQVLYYNKSISLKSNNNIYKLQV